jgi:hypothetical protein
MQLLLSFTRFASSLISFFIRSVAQPAKESSKENPVQD